MTRLAFVLALLATPVAAEVRVVAVSGPLAAMAEALVGDVADVVYPVPQGVDPAHWRPSIAQIGEIQSADVILLNGAGFARWTGKTSLPRARVVVTSTGFKDALIATEGGLTHAHGAAGEHSHDGVAPLVWLDFHQAAQQVEAMAVRLRRALPGHAGQVDARADALVAALGELDARAEALGARLAGRGVLADHPGFEYFARAYGLRLAALDWPPGTVPEAQALAGLQAAVGAYPVLFLWQAPPTEEAARAVAAAGLVSAVIDPGAGDTRDFVAAMTARLDALEAAISVLD